MCDKTIQKKKFKQKCKILVATELEGEGWYWERYSGSFKGVDYTLLKLDCGLIFKLNTYMYLLFITLEVI